MPGEIVNRIDPIVESQSCLMVIAFGKSTSGSYPLAVSVAQGCSKYAETTIGKQTLHMVAFPKNKDGASKALAILKYMGGSKSLQVFCSGRIERNIWQISNILDCYLVAVSCNDFTAHCRCVIDDPFKERPEYGLHYTISITDKVEPRKPVEIQRYLFPCVYLHHNIRFQKDHPAKLEDQVQAAAINNHCEWCPYFDAKAFKALPRKIVMPDGREIIDQTSV